MKEILLKGVNYLLSAILVMLGFQSCDKHYGDNVEYGVPSADFVYQGKVTDISGNPLEGTQVIVKPLQLSDANVWYENNEMPGLNDTLRTDKDGIYTKENIGFYPIKDFRIVVNDLSGKFESDSIQTQAKRETQGSGWYSGKFSVSADFKLKNKE